MDAIDERLVAALTDDGRATFQELGELVGLSANGAAARVRKLEAEGVITGFHAAVSPGALGLPLVAIIDLVLQTGTSVREFEGHLVAHPRILWGAHMTGAYDYQLRVAARDSADLQSLVEELKKELGVRTTHTRIVLKEIGPGG